MITQGSAEAGGMMGLVKVLPFFVGGAGRRKKAVVLPVERTSGCKVWMRTGGALLLLTETGKATGMPTKFEGAIYAKIAARVRETDGVQGVSRIQACLVCPKRGR